MGECSDPSEAVRVRVTSDTVTTCGVALLEVETPVPELEGWPNPEIVKVSTEGMGDDVLPETVEVMTEGPVVARDKESDPTGGV